MTSGNKNTFKTANSAFNYSGNFSSFDIITSKQMNVCLGIEQQKFGMFIFTNIKILYMVTKH